MSIRRIFDRGHRSAVEELDSMERERLRRAIATRQRTARATGILLVPAALLSVLVGFGPLAAGVADWFAIAVQITRLMVPR